MQHHSDSQTDEYHWVVYIIPTKHDICHGQGHFIYKANFWFGVSQGHCL